MSTAVIGFDSQAADGFDAMWLQVGYHMVGALGHRFDEKFDIIDHRLGAVERGQVALTERMDKVEVRLDGVEQRLDGVERRLGTVEHGQVDLRGQVERLERATMRGFDRIEANLESLRGLILRDERRPPSPRGTTGAGG
ncbi:MAG TPA: hypothetical protein VFY84_11570 [Jiangellales bacterium]|nr:hypothetical protein [Jiangellales bacterium]